MKYTVILGSSDDCDSLTGHLVEADNDCDAVQVALGEAGVDWCADAMVLEGHHMDVRQTVGAVTKDGAVIEEPW